MSRWYRGRRRWENPWVSYALIAAVPLVLVLLIAGISALPPYTPSSRAATRPETIGAASPSVPARTASPPASAGGYEAEGATLGRTTRVSAAAGASGGEVVTRVGHGTPSGDVTFDAVDAARAGTYTLTIRYLNGGTAARRLALWVNGRGPTVLSFPPVGADQIGTLRTSVTLRAGTNTVRFSNATTSYGPDLDRITVEPR